MSPLGDADRNRHKKDRQGPPRGRRFVWKVFPSPLSHCTSSRINGSLVHGIFDSDDCMVQATINHRHSRANRNPEFDGKTGCPSKGATGPVEHVEQGEYSEKTRT
jgi:hypothetical protein